MRPAFFGALVLALLGLRPGVKDAEATRADELARYLDSLRRFGQGEHSVAERVEPWPAEQHEGVAARLAAEARATPGTTLLRDAVKLHVTAAWRASLRGTFDAWEQHVKMAQRLLPLAAPYTGPEAARPEGRALRRAVWLSRGYDLLRYWRPSFALDAFKRALELDPRDADALLGAGMAEELRSTVDGLLHDRYFTSDEAFASGLLLPSFLLPEPRLVLMDRENSLRAAERQLRAAAREGATRPEALLRLGRVLWERKRHADAEARWRALLAERPEAHLACLAELFLGRAAESRDDWSAALEHYRAAARAAPRARSAQVALSLALERNGDASEARAVLARLLAQPVDDDSPDDPWVVYHYVPWRRQAALFEGLLGGTR